MEIGPSGPSIASVARHVAEEHRPGNASATILPPPMAAKTARGVHQRRRNAQRNGAPNKVL